MFERYAAHMTEGARKGGKRNWLVAHTAEDHDRFRRGFVRHVMAYLRGEEDEDHASGILFSLNGMEYIKERNDGRIPRAAPDAGEPLREDAEGEEAEYVEGTADNSACPWCIDCWKPAYSEEYVPFQGEFGPITFSGDEDDLSIIPTADADDFSKSVLSRLLRRKRVR